MKKHEDKPRPLFAKEYHGTLVEAPLDRFQSFPVTTVSGIKNQVFSGDGITVKLEGNIDNDEKYEKLWGKKILINKEGFWFSEKGNIMTLPFVRKIIVFITAEFAVVFCRKRDLEGNYTVFVN